MIANAENAAGGAGLTTKIAEELLSAGVDAITLGDHVWDQKNFENEINALERVCRPANLPEANPGRRFLVIEKVPADARTHKPSDSPSAINHYGRRPDFVDG